MKTQSVVYGSAHDNYGDYLTQRCVFRCQPELEMILQYSNWMVIQGIKIFDSKELKWLENVDLSNVHRIIVIDEDPDEVMINLEWFSIKWPHLETHAWPIEVKINEN